MTGEERAAAERFRNIARAHVGGLCIGAVAAEDMARGYDPATPSGAAARAALCELASILRQVAAECTESHATEGAS